MKELVIPIINIVPTMRCNLRCRFCSTQAPYYQSPYHPSMEWLQQQADRLFEIIDFADRFIISGGEVMVRRDLYRWVDHLKKYADKIGRLELNSNGTIEPDAALLQSLASYPGKKRFLVDDYGPEISRSAKKIAEIYQTIPNAIVEPRDYFSDQKYCGGWVDYGVYDLTQLHRKTKEEAVKCWSTCSSPRARYFMSVLNGKLYHCARQVWLVANEIEAEKSDELIDLFDPELPIPEMREKIAALYKMQSFETCRFCMGLHDDAPRYKPAMQMTREEQLAIWRANSHG